MRLPVPRRQSAGPLRLENFRTVDIVSTDTMSNPTFAAAWALAFVCAAVPAASQPPPPQVRSAPRILTVEAWREDLRVLVETVSTKHRAPWAFLPEGAFRRAAADLDARVPTLSDSAIVVEMAALVAMLQDGHSRLSLPLGVGEAQGRAHQPTPSPAERELVMRRYPVAFHLFEDGLFIDAATESHVSLIGSQVVRIGPESADEALRAVRRVTSADNDSGHTLGGPRLLSVAEVCQAIGLTADADRLTLAVTSPDGREREVELRPLDRASDPKLVEASQLPGAKVPVWMKNPTAPHWFEPIPATRAVFAQINAITDAPDRTMAQFAADLAAFIRSHDVDRLILDLRWNGGGNNYLSRSLVLALAGLPAINRAGSLYTLVGRYTFSAAMNLTSQLELWTNTIFAGEPTGASPSHYGDARRYTLPRSGLTVRLSSVYWRDWSVDERRTAVVPELAVAMTSRDYFEGRDPVLEAALTHRVPEDIAGQLLQAFDNGGADAAWRRRYLLRSDPRTAGVDLYDALRRVGRALLEKKQTANAVGVFQENLASRPDAFEANADLGEALLADGAKADAVPYLEKALALRPDARLRALLGAAKR
jgi:tetratricopeptide (TPR) repeat protein